MIGMNTPMMAQATPATTQRASLACVMEPVTRPRAQLASSTTCLVPDKLKPNSTKVWANVMNDTTSTYPA